MMQSNVPRAICINPSLILSKVCCEAGFSEPIFSNVSQERFSFEFSVKCRRDACSSSGTFSEIEVTGFPFREKVDALESAALSALENLLYYHGISSCQYNDIVFCEQWPLFRHLSENIKATKTAVMRLLDEIFSICQFVDSARLSFLTWKSDLDGVSAFSTEIVMLDECEAELRGIHDSLLVDGQQYRDNFRHHCQPNRPDLHGYYKSSYNVKSVMDTKARCSSVLNLTLNRLCEATCYSSGSISCKQTSSDSYVADISIMSPSDSDDQEHLPISSAECATISEAQHMAMYRAIWYICRTEGYKIIDPGYSDFSDMQRDIYSLRYELPTLCEMLVDLKKIIEPGLSRLQIICQKYYRELRRNSVLSELRILLGDCMSEFLYLCTSVDGELGKVETYSASLPMSCSMTGVV